MEIRYGPGVPLARPVTIRTIRATRTITVPAWLRAEIRVALGVLVWGLIMGLGMGLGMTAWVMVASAF